MAFRGSLYSWQVVLLLGPDRIFEDQTGRTRKPPATVYFLLSAMSKPTQTLFLLDAFALIYRAHFAFIKSPRITSTGMNTSAVFGFTNTLLEVLKKEKPTHMGVVFDTPKPTFRHVQYEAYKAQREAQPEDITIAIPYVKKLCKTFFYTCFLFFMNNWIKLM